MAENRKRVPMAERPAAERARSFEEVALGYTAEEARQEAERCLHCKKRPCTGGCPVGVPIPEFVGKVAEGDFAAAYELVRRANALPAVCGRVCPQENQCEGKCVRGNKGESVAIGRLERFVADWAAEQGLTAGEKAAPNGHRVAVVGSGPAGLSCAGELCALGYSVTVFELLHKVGGVLSYGIPEFRLPKSIVEREAAQLAAGGVEFVTNAVVGSSVTVDELLDEYEAVFLGSGAGLPNFLGIPGENLLGVYSANEYLTRINLMKAYRSDYDTPVKHHRRVAVVGGGNVAMDAARCALRLGAEEVSIVYRRGMEELPARREEVEHAMAEGIRFRLLSNPVEVLGDEKGRVRALRCAQMTYGESDESGRRSVHPVEGSEFLLEADAMIDALGTNPNPLLRSTTEGLDADRRGRILTDGELATSREGVFAGGDAVTGAATVILAMGAGKKAAHSIHRYIQSKQ